MEIIGNETKRTMLHSLLEKDSISLCFKGKSGIGKKLIAIEFIKEIFSLENKKFNREDKPITDINNHPDFMMIEPQNELIPISKIRDMLNFLSLKSYLGGSKCVIINDSHLMNQESQNALLKKLEEPRKGEKIILITDRFMGLLPTVRSRLMVIEFDPLKDEEINKILGYNLSKERLALLEGSVSLAENYDKFSLDELSSYAKGYISNNDLSFIKEEYEYDDFIQLGNYTLKVLEGMLMIKSGEKSVIRDSDKFLRELNPSVSTIINKIKALDRALKDYDKSYNKKLLLARMNIEGR